MRKDLNVFETWSSQQKDCTKVLRLKHSVQSVKLLPAVNILGFEPVSDSSAFRR